MVVPSNHPSHEAISVMKPHVLGYPNLRNHHFTIKKTMVSFDLPMTNPYNSTKKWTSNRKSTIIIIHESLYFHYSEKVTAFRYSENPIYVPLSSIYPIISIRNPSFSDKLNL